MILVVVVVVLPAAPSRGADQQQITNLADAVRVRVVGRSLHVEWVAPMQPPLRPLALNGPEAVWRVRAMRGVSGGLEVERPPARTPLESFGYRHDAVSAAAPDRLVVTARRGGRTANDTQLRFTQGPGGAVQLVVTDNVEHTFAQARAADLVELRASHARLVRQFLVPLLRQMTGRDPLVPGAADVYAVFEEIAPDERTAAAVRELLPQLGDPSYARRESASARLAALGPRSVCAIARMNRDELMPEVQARCAALLEAHTHRAIDDRAAARRDAVFLIDCLEFAGDDRVRWAAKSELERFTGRTIPLHPAPTEDEWSAAADVLRRRLASPDAPATAPAAVPSPGS
jgi:hypothetical protein